VRYLRKRLKFVAEGFCVLLDLIGLGFTTTFLKESNTLRLNVGYNHSIYVKVPSEIFVNTKKRCIFIYGIDLKKVNDFVYLVKSFRKLNPYKLKGIKNRFEHYEKKIKSLK